MRLKFLSPTILLVIILILGALFRFYKFDWGEGYFFNPDENDVGISVNQLSFPSQMNPHLFKYGSVNIYSIYFTKVILEKFNLNPNPLLIGRFYSALFSTLTILIIFFISKKIMDQYLSLVSAFLIALTPGLIQQAHFSTPETNQIFFLLTALLFLLSFIQNAKIFNLFITSIAFGLAVGVKVSSLPFLPILILALFFVYKFDLKRIIFSAFLMFLTISLTFAIFSPFALIDFQSFYRSILYEKQVATGEVQVFYTRQFIDTIPILFQLKNIFPFALGPALEFFGLIGLGVTIFSVIRRPNKMLLLVLLAFLVLFFINAFLFVKWTRYMSTSLPFFAIFAGYFIYRTKNNMKLALFLNSIILVLTVLTFSAFLSIYIKHDSRITASNWLLSNIPIASTIMVESANVIDIPVSGWAQRYSLSFYNLDDDSQQRSNILDKLEQSDYFVIQSRRVFANHMRLPNLFPKTARFYNELFSGNLGFEEIKEFHSFPSFSLLGLNIESPDEQAEETWSVFDHPVIRVFKKQVNLSREEYAKIITD